MTDALFNTNVADVIVPDRFTDYVQQLTEEKSNLVQSGVLERSALLDTLLAGGGLVFNVPSWRDLDNDADNVASDATADHFAHILNGASIDLDAALSALSDSRPKATGSSQEKAVRLSRNQSWAGSDLAAALAGSDPMASIGGRVATYWSRRLQAAFVATVNGISKDNGANDSGDYAFEAPGIGSGFTDGVTNLTAEHVIDAKLTLGDSMEDLGAIMVHSTVMARMKKNNLIDFIPDSQGVVSIPTFLGLRVIVDDGMPTGTSVVRQDGSAGIAGMYESWIFGPGAVMLGVSSPKVPTAVVREEQAGNGSGQEVLYSRVEWAIHMAGHAYDGSAPDGGPGNGTGSNALNNAGSWDRVFPERKQIKFARLITRES